MSKAKSPKLLFLAWNFPPAEAIGAVRTGNIAKHLARLGWDVTVVTPDRRLMRHVPNSQKTTGAWEPERLRHILTDHHWRFLAPNHLNCRNRGLSRLVGGLCRRLVARLGISSAIG